MLQEKILEAARPYLEGRTVTDLVLGIALIGAQLDGENVGVSYMLRDSLPSGCGSFGFARQEIFQPVARASGARLAFGVIAQLVLATNIGMGARRRSRDDFHVLDLTSLK